MNKLAIFGGSPVRENPISYGKQYIDEQDIACVVDVLRSDYLTCGPKTTALEQKICEITDAKYCVAVSNGTTALHISALAAGIGEGDEVITTPITFAASANCILYCGATPVFADINPNTYNIDPESARKLITPKTKAIIAVDFSGQAADLEPLRAICDEYHLFLIEDAAHSMGTKYNNKPVGSIADITTFSFHPVKTVTCGEGGAVTTNSKELYDKLVLAHSHGITRNREQMKNPTDDPWYNEQVSLGYNYRMTEIQAALLISQLDKLPAFSKRRKEIVNRYNEAFKDCPEIQVQEEIAKSDTTRHLYILRLRSEICKCNRRQMFDALWEEGIRCQVHYLPVYWHSHYENLGYPKGLCPNAEKYYLESLSLPLFYSMTDEDVESVITAVKKVLDYYKTV